MFVIKTFPLLCLIITRAFLVISVGLYFTISIVECALQEAGLDYTNYRLYRINDEKVLSFGNIKVSFFDTDLSKVEEIKYHEQAIVHFEARFSDGMIFPEILDLSKVGQVIIKNYSNETAKQIKFKDGADVELDLSVYPEVLDFSRCGEVNLRERNVENIHKIIFIVFFCKNIFD